MMPDIAAPAHEAAPRSAVEGNTVTVTTARIRHAKPGRDSLGIWLYIAAVGLFALAGAAAAVSFSAQYRLVYAARGLAVPAALEAAIPDVAALVFACLGVALALRGRRAIRARLLNMAAAASSVFMNVIAAAPGWRDLAVWAMPPVAYMASSDTLIGVVRASAIARQQDSTVLIEEVTVLAMLSGLMLWLLRLTMAPTSTLAGFRTWVLEECPVAPGRRAAQVAPVTQPVEVVQSGVRPPVVASRARGSGLRSGTKTARFLALVADRHGSLATIPLGSVAKISAQVAPEADLNGGAARAALRRAVLAAQDGGQ
jgi:hypothetical protein